MTTRIHLKVWMCFSQPLSKSFPQHFPLHLGLELAQGYELPGKGRAAVVTDTDLQQLETLLAPWGHPVSLWLSGAFLYLSASLELNLEDIYKLVWEWTCSHHTRVSAEPNHYLIMLVDVEEKEKNHLNMDHNSPWLHLCLWEIITLSGDTYSKWERCHLLLWLLGCSSLPRMAFHLSSEKWISLTCWL